LGKRGSNKDRGRDPRKHFHIRLHDYTRYRLFRRRYRKLDAGAA
jgi:hypothetical protein